MEEDNQEECLGTTNLSENEIEILRKGLLSLSAEIHGALFVWIGLVIPTVIYRSRGEFIDLLPIFCSGLACLCSAIFFNIRINKQFNIPNKKRIVVFFLWLLTLIIVLLTMFLSNPELEFWAMLVMLGVSLIGQFICEPLDNHCKPPAAPILEGCIEMC